MSNRAFWIEVFQGKTEGYFWRLIAKNGEVIAHSEQYTTKWNAKRTAKRLSRITGFDVFDDAKN